MKYVIAFVDSALGLYLDVHARGDALARAEVFDSLTAAKARRDSLYANNRHLWHVLELPQAQALETLRSL